MLYLLFLLYLGAIRAENLTQVLTIYTTLDGEIVRETLRTIENPVEMTHPVFPLGQPISPINMLIIRDVYHWITACHWTREKMFASVMRQVEPELYEKILPVNAISRKTRGYCSGVEFTVSPVQRANLILLPKISVIGRWCCSHMKH